MSEIGFHASECDSEGNLNNASYQYVAAKNKWRVMREGELCLELGPGYVPVKVKACGVCATDLARHHLPYPLPQITGHEVVGETEEGAVVIDINASHLARGHRIDKCPYCSGGLPSHCPDRITLGIDRLPGGFAPWVLAPKNGIIPVGDVPSEAAVLIEPLAAAIQALAMTPPQDGDKVAVLGPRRLGMLLIAALAARKESSNAQYDITAITRRSSLLALAGLMGADKGLHGGIVPPESLREKYDIVYDTTGHPAGLAQSLSMARRIVHLKSTHGGEVMGMRRLSDFVVDELALLPLDEQHLSFGWPGEQRANRNVLVTPGVPRNLLPEAGEHAYHMYTPKEACRALKEPSFLEDSPFPQFDLAIVSSLEEVDAIIRPYGRKRSLVRPRGAILLAPLFGETPLEDAINARHLQIHSSRCGNFNDALSLLSSFPYLSQLLSEDLVSHRFPVSELDKALAVAASGEQGIKVVVEHDD